MNPDSVARLIRTPCTLEYRTQTGTPDEYGTPTWETAETSDLVAIFPANTAARTDTGELTTRPAGKQADRGFFRSTTRIDHLTAVRVGTQKWEVNGPPRPWTHPVTGELIYIEVDLEAWTDHD